MVAIKSFIPAVVLKNRTPNGKLGNADMNEIRRVTVLLISVSELHPDASSSLLKSVSLPVQTIQAIASKYEGSIAHLQVKKEIVIGMIAFGLPGVSHGDDAVRAVKAALQVKQDLAR